MSLVGLIRWHEFLLQRKVPSIMCVTFWVFLLLDYFIVRRGPLPTDSYFLYCYHAKPSAVVFGFLGVVEQSIGVLLACLIASITPSCILRHRHVKYIL